MVILARGESDHCGGLRLQNFTHWQQAFAYLEREIDVLRQLLDILHAQAKALSHVDLEQLETCQLQLEAILAEAENNTFKRVKWQRATFGNRCTPTWKSLCEMAPEDMKIPFQKQVLFLTELGAKVRQVTEQNHRSAGRAERLLSELREVSFRSTRHHSQLYTSRGKLGRQGPYQTTLGGTP